MLLRIIVRMISFEVMKSAISPFFLTLLFCSGAFAQSDKKFYQHRKFWRNINQGTWLGVGGEYQQIKQSKNALFIAPDFHLRYGGIVPRFYLSMSLSTLFNFYGPIEYKNVGDADYRMASYRYLGYRIEAGAGYYIKHFFRNKATYGLAVGANFSVINVGGLDLDRLSPLITSGQSIVIRKYNGNDAGEIKPYIAIDRYLWLLNKQLAIQLTYSYPAWKFKKDYIFSYENQYFLNKSSGHSVSLRLLYNLSPVIKYNPTKMQEL